MLHLEESIEPAYLVLRLTHSINSVEEKCERCAVEVSVPLSQGLFDEQMSKEVNTEGQGQIKKLPDSVY